MTRRKRLRSFQNSSVITYSRSAWLLIQVAGYCVKVIFLQLKDVDAEIECVAQLVRQGGHGISEEVMRRRFNAGLANFPNLYAPLVGAWALYDNSNTNPLLLDWGERT